MIRINTVFLFSLSVVIAFAQQKALDHTHLHIAYNTMDSLIAYKDYEGAKGVYEDLRKEGYYIDAWKQYDFADTLYYWRGDKKKAKKEVLESAKKGVYNFHKLYEIEEDFAKAVENKYGEKFLNKVIRHNEKLTQKLRKNYGAIIDEMIALAKLDQELYKNKEYKQYRSYWFRKTYNFPLLERDSALDHNAAMSGYWEFRYKDSLKTERFNRIIEQLGYVPDERITGGLTEDVLVVHSCKYEKMSINNDSIYLKSIKLGTLTPHEYAWYKGFYDERHTDSHTYYYTIGRAEIEDFPPEKVAVINERRKRIGLRPWPAVVWKTKIYPTTE
ncbi:MAG: hypothetical protein AAFO82_17280 [Bacteroidota bacterium]